jgi:high-affinity iron transporter
LGLSLKMPKWLGVLGSSKKKPEHGDEVGLEGLSIRSIRFNVAWNIWREVAECGVFLVPFFLSGEGVAAIPLSALIGSAVGLLCGLGIYWANKKFTNKLGLTIFAVLLLIFISAGLFSGGCNKLEEEIGETPQAWKIHGNFWSAHRLPMTIVKPFGYSDTRTVLQIVSYWFWLALSGLLHFRKVRISPRIGQDRSDTENELSDDSGSQLDEEGGQPEDGGLPEEGGLPEDGELGEESGLPEDGGHPLHEATTASSLDQIECTFAEDHTVVQNTI